MRKDRILCGFIVLVIAAVLLTGCASVKAPNGYRLYVGTNDKDTYQLEIPLEEQKAILLDIISKYTGGVTIYEATGYWVDETDTMTIEKTFVCEFFDTPEELLEKVVAEICVELNQNSVPIVPW